MGHNKIKDHLELNKQKITGIVQINRLVAEYDILLDQNLFPILRMRVKVFERENDYAAFSNLSRCDRSTGAPDGIAGLGCTEDEALTDLLNRFVTDVREHLPPNGYDEADFAWSSPEDF